VDVGMNHESSGTPSNGLNGSFGHTVLMMCANARQVDDLLCLFEDAEKFGSGEDAVVCMVIAHGNIEMEAQILLELAFREDGL
jgi:hypothetical protein